jgi:hypothetical protein
LKIANEKLTAFLELELAVCIHLLSEQMLTNNRSDGCKRYVVRADEMLAAFVELKSAICASSELV